MEKEQFVTVFGSANNDLFFKIDRPPQIGETISSKETQQFFGGKGCNTVVALAKLGYNTSFIGQVGNDSYGTNIKNMLNHNKVNTQYMKILENNVTGQAYIFSYPDGDNSIVLVGGANTDWTNFNPQNYDEVLNKTNFLMLQREVSDSVNMKLAEYAREKGIKVILDVGGQDIRLEKEFLKNVDIISPNETELLRIIKHGVEFDLFSDESVISVCNSIRDDSGNKDLEFLIKLGSKGSLFLTKENKIIRQSAINVSSYKIIDTTGAGDCFTGAFVGKYSEQSSKGELDIQSCLRFASAAAFSCITKYGTSNAMPTKEEAETILSLSSK